MNIVTSVGLIYVIPQIIYYIYSYNLSVKKHIAENKEMFKMLQNIQMLLTKMAEKK